MAIRDGERHKAYLGPPLCSTEQRQLAYDFIVRNHAAGRLPHMPDFQDPIAGYVSVFGLDEEHAIADSAVVIRQADGREILVRPKRILP